MSNLNFSERLYLIQYLFHDSRIPKTYLDHLFRGDPVPYFSMGISFMHVVTKPTLNAHFRHWVHGCSH